MNLFKEWMTKMGFNGKQVSVAASTLGVNAPRTASSIYTGDRELSLTELLAMSAIRADLKPWTPENDAEAAAAAQVVAVVRRFQPSSLADASASDHGKSLQ